MERIAPGTNVLNLAPCPTPRPVGLARTCAQFTVRCLKSLARGYVESAMYYPYWGWTGTPPPPLTSSAPR
jgi:hypothetical protein